MPHSFLTSPHLTSPHLTSPHLTIRLLDSLYLSVGSRLRNYLQPILSSKLLRSSTSLIFVPLLLMALSTPSRHLFLGLPTRRFPSGFYSRYFFGNLSSPMHLTCPYHFSCPLSMSSINGSIPRVNLESSLFLRRFLLATPIDNYGMIFIYCTSL